MGYEPQPAQNPPAPPQSDPSRWQLPDNIWRSDFWFNKIGLGLLLLALAFLFNYAVDQGWILPPARVAIGLMLGTALLGTGYKTARKRPHFGQAVQGGGIAAYYITGFAAFRLYDLVPFEVAFGFMFLVTVLAFMLSLRQKEAMLSLIGGLVALATLFALVGKLFLIDLVLVEPVWRILLFAGFGGLFLFISYFYRSWLGLPDLAE